MQEQKKYQIEKVEHCAFDYYLKGEEKACIIINRPNGIIEQINLFFEHSANKGFSYYAVGRWKIKCIHHWKTNIKEQYQECRKCGIGHAL